MMFSASRSRRLSIVAIIQSLAQLEKNYDKQGAEIIVDNCQYLIFGGFAPNSQTAETLSKNLGNKTILSGTVSKGKGDSSQSLQMIERPLMTPDELKSMPKGSFIVMKTGTNPMKVKLELFINGVLILKNLITSNQTKEQTVEYISKYDIIASITGKEMFQVKTNFPALKKGRVKVE